MVLVVKHPSIGAVSRCRRHGFDPWVGKIPEVGNGNPLLYSCWENSQDRSLVGYSPWGCQESDMTVYAHAMLHICSTFQLLYFSIIVFPL